MDLGTSFKQEAFRRLLKRGFTFRLRGDQPFASEKYHVFVVLNYNPVTDRILLLVNGTSQVEKRQTILRRMKVDVTATTVLIPAGA